MDKPLKRVKRECYHFVDGVRIAGVHSGIWGNVSGLRGDVTGIWGNASGIRGNVSITGDVSGIRGDVTGIRGNVTGIMGNFDLTPMEARKDKPNVSDWVEERHG